MIAIDIDNQLDSQEFRQSFEGADYLLKFLWNDRTGEWIFEIYNPEAELLGSTPLHTGVSLFAEYRSLKTLPPGQFILVDLRTGYPEFKREDLGVTVKLFYVELSEYASIIGT